MRFTSSVSKQVHWHHSRSLQCTVLDKVNETAAACSPGLHAHVIPAGRRVTLSVHQLVARLVAISIHPTDHSEQHWYTTA